MFKRELLGEIGSYPQRVVGRGRGVASRELQKEKIDNGLWGGQSSTRTHTQTGKPSPSTIPPGPEVGLYGVNDGPQEGEHFVVIEERQNGPNDA